MSAIFGIWHINGQAVEQKPMQVMLDKLRQYGRDKEAIELHDNIGLGCCLNALSRSQIEGPVLADAAQTMLLVGDALIYNREELIHEHGLADNDDIANQALLLAAYQKWGEDCPTYINGDFAFAIWEKQKQRLTLVRDHLGVRPLFYFYQQSTFAFATDLRALLALPFVGRGFDEVRLYALISNTYHIDTAATYFEQIRRLPSAHTLRITGQGLRKTKYWTPGSGKIVYQTEAEYSQALYSLVADAIQRRLRSTDKKIGAELSGGLDSSVITVLANRELAKENKKLPLFSWSPPFSLFPRQSRDERDLIELVCRQEDLTCGYYEPGKDSDQPGYSGALSTDGGTGEVLDTVVREMSKQGVRLLLSGWGGDQGISHRGSLKELAYTGHWQSSLKEAYFLANGSPWRFCKLLIASTVLPLFGPFGYFGNPNKGIPTFVRPTFAKKMRKRCKKDILYFSVDPVKHLESGNIQTRTELVAWLGAEYNLQYLFPFLDYRVVDFAMSIPKHLFFKQGINRYVYRKAFAGILPKAVCDYSYKDDIARITFFREKKSMIFENDTFRKLNPELFGQYIDFEQLEAIVTSCGNDEFETERRVDRTLRVCRVLQQLLAEAEG